MYSFPNSEPICCSMSGSNYCFLTWIQVSQETVKVVWYSYLFKNFPQFIVTHTLKGFGVIIEAEVDVFPEFPCFLYDPTNAGNSTSGPLPLRKPACTSGLSQFTYCWGQACRILSITLLACEMSVTVWLFEHSLALPLFGTGMKTDLLQSYRHC